jgi:hypothetical protein
LPWCGLALYCLHDHLVRGSVGIERRFGLLSNLFRLDGTPTILATGAMPSMSPGDTVASVVFPPGAWVPPVRKIKNVTFRNVAFSKTTISQVTFTDCRFEDCLFTGAHLNEVEFHGCDLVNCTLWKIRLTRVYLHPERVKLARKYSTEAANVGISVFQAMLSNFTEERQDFFFMLADIRFRRWKRYQIAHDLREEKKTTREASWEWICSITHEVLAGFGYRPLRFFMWTVVLFLAVSYMNYLLIGDTIQVARAGGVSDGPAHASFVDSVFYSFSVLTVLGFSSVTPSSDGAKILTVLEALASIGWLGIFTAVLVKRFLR